MTKLEMMQKLMDKMLDTYKAKNHDYGDSFSKSYEEFGMIAPVVRMNDKMERVKSLTKKDKQKVEDEVIRDTLMDLANYALMTIVEMDLDYLDQYHELPNAWANFYGINHKEARGIRNDLSSNYENGDKLNI